ncbi:hypothetical protein KIN20_028163 [Parelaphostrongylus tenuis]|uniref:Uncharacterized protein n=1 Tax=Parelaphostrongylus tenuis TaxID=148309 RepID=A0AAD5WEK5_PARTN|nr:hypothetical protein KIN20_028163 [Parelaphostrongylus tenuis]
MEERHGRRAKSVDALKQCEHNPHALVAADEQEKMLKKCEEAKPHHEELWVSVSKDPKHWRKQTGEILKTVVNNISIPS